MGVMQLSTVEIIKAVAYLATIGLVDLSIGAVGALSQRFRFALVAALRK